MPIGVDIRARGFFGVVDFLDITIDARRPEMDEEIDIARVDLMVTLILEALPAKPFLK